MVDLLDYSYAVGLLRVLHLEQFRYGFLSVLRVLQEQALRILHFVYHIFRDHFGSSKQ